MSVRSGALHREYASVVIDKNTNALCSLRRELVRAFNVGCLLDRFNFVVAATGSDGRLEKTHLSKTEIFVILTNGMDLATKIISQIRDVSLGVKCFSSGCDFSISPIIEIKRMNEVLSYAFGSTNRIFPNRVLDAQPLIGRDDILREARGKLLDEWVGPEGRRIKEGVSDRVRQYRALMLSGKQTFHGQELVHYDLSRGEFYYSPPSDVLPVARSTKYGPLRFIQMFLVHELMKLTRVLGPDGKNLMSGLIEELPQNTVSRLDFLANDKRCKLTKEQLAEVADSYAFFLCMLGLSESEYRANGSTVLDIGEDTAREATERLTSLNAVLSNSMFSVK